MKTPNVLEDIPHADVDARLFLFEVLERGVRLASHIERSREAAARPGSRPTAQLKIAKDAQKLVEEHIGGTLSAYTKAETSEAKCHALRSALGFLAQIHERILGAVPRPYEPIELVSYLRQTLFEPEVSDDPGPLTEVPEVFATEALGDQAHHRFYVDATQSDRSFQAAEAVFGSLTDFAERQLDGQVSTKALPPNMGYVSLPRIDLGNPCRWPSLLHEVGHFYYEDEKVWRSFCEMTGEEGLKNALQLIQDYAVSPDEASCQLELQAWLQECWCDAFAITRAGPSAFFAQMHAFFFSSPCYLSTPAKKGANYPPAGVRLKLLLTSAENRFQSDDPAATREIYQAMERDKKLIHRLFDVRYGDRQDLFQLLHVFRGFIAASFSRAAYLKTSDISSAVLHRLVEELGSGLPIPAVERDEIGEQRAATPAEILLAGWFHRNTAYKEDFLQIVDTWYRDQIDPPETLIKHLQAKVKRADECLKRSLQVVEWFRILEESSKNSSPGEESLPSDLLEQSSEFDLTPGLLSDVQLRRLLTKKELRIIPLIDYERQVKGTVIDLRLGHNFEIFFSNVYGAIDPLVGRNQDEVDSMEMDVDFLQNIAIGPGQFMLAHTLEYLNYLPI